MNRWISVAAATMLTVAASAAVGKSRIEPGAWIVELSDPPTVEFRGGTPESVQRVGGSGAPSLQATAPAVVGADRLRVDSAAVRAYVKHLDGVRARSLSRASAALGRDVRPRHVFRHLVNGYSVELTDAEARRIADLPGVKSVEPVYVQTLHTDAGPGWIGAPPVWAGSAGAPSTRGEGTVIGVIDTGVNWESVFFDTSQSSEPVTNPRGEFFGLCNDAALSIPCNDKLIGVYDFTDEGTNGFDPDGHGSHTASTAVGLPLTFSVSFGRSVTFSTSGIAPRASFIAYKACREPDDGEGGFECLGDDTTAALEQAIEDGVDVVNYSIGGDPFSPWSQGGNQRVFLNLREAGIVPVASAGNSGRDGDATVGSPANTPWVMAAANASHGLVLANRVVDTSGGAFALGELTGEGFTDGVGTRPIVHARDFGSALCGVGQSEAQQGTCAELTGATNPFSPGTFDGEIVVCDRGNYGRVEKGFNVLEAGAGGMILANTDAQGESTIADDHCLPATHVGAADGDRLRDWLDGGSNHRGRLTGNQRYIDDELSGRLAASSSRGPAVAANGVMKPNVTAPGTEVLAASTETNPTGDGPGPNASNQIGFLSGTSMAAPHVAGAALLLRSAHPDWDVDAVISALETTADPDIVTNGDGSEARIIDRGAGGVQVDRAIRAGLYLPVTEQEFLDANPAGFGGGDPQSLNLAGLIDENCVGTCTFTRTVRALADGSWTVQTEGELDISVTPTSFSLSEGGEQQLSIDVSRGQSDVGAWGSGSVVLSPNGGGFATQRLPAGILVAAADLPEIAEYTSQTNRGRGVLNIPEVVELAEFAVRTSALVRPEQREASLGQDSTNDSPYDGPSGTETVLVDVPPGSLMLHAETFASETSDVDLFVGFDADGDGFAEESEEVCASISTDDLELCDIRQPEAGTWWIVVQNWLSPSVGPKNIPYEFAVLTDADDPSLSVPGPGATDAGALELQVYWDQPAMQADQRWFGAVGFASAPDRTADVGVVPVTVTRTGDNEIQEVALFEGQPYTLVIPGGTAHDLMYIDVPTGATGLTVTAEGEIDDLTLGRRGLLSLAPQLPDTPAAPGAVLAQGEQNGGTWTAEVQSDGGTIDRGRYYVVLDNSGSTERSVTVTATVTGTPALSATRGLWQPESRSINQGIDFQRGGGGWFAVWFTYDEQGLPTFYITDTVSEVDDSFFSAVLFRPTTDDIRQNLEVVGEVQITVVGENRFVYAWRLNGNHGAEFFRPVTNASCVDLGEGPVPLLGHYTSPVNIAGGATVLVNPSNEAWVRYFYDDLNRPRWVLADTELEPATVPGGLLMEVLQFQGWCIYCPQVPVTSESIGTLERQFLADDTAREVSDFVMQPPLDVSVDVDRQIERISAPVSCDAG